MNYDAIKEVLNELFSHLEKLETQNEAILQFLKEKKRVTDKQLAPYLEQAGNASNVKWRAARIRIEHLLSPEHPEKEVKLGKRPELREDSGEMKKTASKSTETQEQPAWDANEGQRPKLADQEKSAAGAKQPRPADGKAAKREEQSEVERKNAEQPAPQQREQKSESVRHPTEMTEQLTRDEGAEPATRLKSNEKDKEAA